MKFLDNEFFVPIYLSVSRSSLESAKYLRKNHGIIAHFFSEKFNIFQRLFYFCHYVKPFKSEFLAESLICFARDLEDHLCPVILICQESERRSIEKFSDELESRFIILDEKDLK